MLRSAKPSGSSKSSLHKSKTRQITTKPILSKTKLHKKISKTLPTSPVSKQTASLATKPAITAENVLEAYDRIKGKINRSPVEFSESFSKLSGAKVYLKKEHSTSMTGSYKERGALNKLLTLTEEQRAGGVICSSAGNHAQAVSLWSTKLGIDSVIVMPETTPHVKVQKTANFGGTVVQHGRSFGEAYTFAKELCDYEGRTFIHAFDDPFICAGAGTVAVELVEQNPFLDAVIIPVGGGGLIAGMSTLIKHVNPRIKIYGVEAELMPGMQKSLLAGHVVSVPKQSTMADGIAIERVGETPFSQIQRYVDSIVSVSEDDLAHSVLQLLEVEKTLVEPAGAAGITALMGPLREQLVGKQVGVVITGSNIDMSLLGRIISKGLVRSGRLARISVTIRDSPGQLAKICDICAQMGVNIREVKHERAFLLDTVGITQPCLDIETRNFEHIEKLVERLKKEDFIDCHVVTPYH